MGNMKKGILYISKNWYWMFVCGLFFLQALVFLIFRENSYIAVHDNMDLFVAHLQILKNTDTFFAQNVDLPMLGGVSRDTFGSEFSLYNILYYLLPNFWAYMAGYVLKIAIGVFSFILLAKDVYGDKYEQYRPLVWVIAAAFGMIPVFPAYGISFTSVPLIVWLLRRIYMKPDKWLFLGVFVYPLVSYFSYFGFFILAYIVCAVILLWIRDKRLPKGIALSCIILARSNKFAGTVINLYFSFNILRIPQCIHINILCNFNNLFPVYDHVLFSKKACGRFDQGSIF